MKPFVSWKRAGGRRGARLRPLVAAGGKSLRRRTLLELIKIDQEHRYQAAGPKLLESYLEEWPELAADTESLAELLEAECMTRFAAGEAPSQEELAARFPRIVPYVDLGAIAAEVEREGGASESGAAAAGDGRGQQDQSRRRNRYQIRAVWGGAHGTVYRAYDTQLQRDVALKVPSADVGNDPETWARLFSEARAVARIQHRNVCPVFDVGQSHGRYYLAMALVQGESLAVPFAMGLPGMPPGGNPGMETCRGIGRGACGGDHSSRRQAAERDDRRRGRAALDRLWSCSPGPGRPRHAGRRLPVGDPGLHVAGTNTRRAGHLRQRHLCPGCRSLPDVDRLPAVYRPVAEVGNPNSAGQAGSAPRPPYRELIAGWNRSA